MVHAYFNLIIKIASSPKFRHTTVLQMVIHAVECVSMPSVFRDWDMDEGSVQDHRRRHKRVLVEMVLTIIVRFFFNSVMLVPVVFTGFILCLICFEMLESAYI